MLLSTVADSWKVGIDELFADAVDLANLNSVPPLNHSTNSSSHELLFTFKIGDPLLWPVISN